MAVVPFYPEPFTDFSREENRAAFQAALEKVRNELGKEYPLIINGERVTSDKTFDSINPANPSQLVGRVSQATREHYEQAIAAAQQAFESWSRMDPKARARILLRAAAMMRRRKHEFSAWMVFEVGKTWAEADADTAEAIDFLEYYARQMIRLSEGAEVTPLRGEDSEIRYIPLGVGGVIPPFNFPVAIFTGTTVAPVVAGNTVIVKPAVPTPVCGFKVVELLMEAGMPPGVINYLPTSGTDVGEWLVEDPRTAFINFTGSKAVGTKIYEEAAKLRPGQRWLKKVAAEMGGKDAIVVDADCDLEDAANNIVASAFGFAGQKCSACSRAIIHQDVYDKVLEMVVAKTKALKVGDPTDPTTNVPPVAERKYYEKVLSYIEIGKQEGRLMCGGGPLETETGGFYIQPTIFADVDPKARIAQEEIFGPVLAFHKAPDFKSAIAMANDTDYGLTGSVFSRNRENLEYARHEFHVGNLYFNRKCTGAIVGSHAFGGFKLSGTGAKAGGPDHLLEFLVPKTVAERL